MPALADFDVPLLAAVNGLAVGFGTTLLPWCDIVLVGARARFRVPFVSLGVTTEAGSSVTLATVMGPQAAARFVLTGDWLSRRGRLRRRARRQLVPDDELVAEALALAAPHRRPAAERPAGDDPPARAGRTDAWLAAIERENAVFAELAGGPENLAAIEPFFTRSQRSPAD